jgi:flavin reductase (DIM6/NTAB) family NADH-FMN oxidoreductase RutF
VLTIRHEDQETGMVVSWVQQAGFEPPAITVAVNRERYVCDWITAGEPFVINVMREGERTLLRHFVHGFGPGEPAFDDLEITRTPGGAPILSAALGHLECEPQRHMDSGDHRIFLAQVTGGHLSDTADPMSHVRKNGLRY